MGQGTPDLPGGRSIALVMAFSISLAKLLDLAGLQNQVLAADACDCLISVFAVFFILLFSITGRPGSRKRMRNPKPNEEKIDA